MWDWERKQRLNAFANGNPPGTRCTSTMLMGDTLTPLLLVGSTDGCVRVWHGWQGAGEQRQGAAWQLADIETASSASGAGHAGGATGEHVDA